MIFSQQVTNIKNRLFQGHSNTSLITNLF